MNNDAFQKLVKERATEKSSKEIAREAVEQEFQQHKRKRKRRRGAGGSSDEDGDDDDSDVDDDRKQKKDEKKKEEQQQEDHSKQGVGKKEKTASKYRDRAKERREGDNTDYQDSQRLLAGVAAAAEDGEDDDVETISKFLGGDEAYTHLVKGLDVTLAKQSVRKQNASTQPRKAGDVSDYEKRPYFAENKNDAKELVVTDIQLVSELGREMLDYLCTYHASTRDSSKAVAVTPAGLVVQRSTLTFSLQANPGEFVRSWEVPREQTYATASDGTAYTKASPLPSSLLDRIESTLTRQMSLAREETKVAGSLTCGTTGACGEEDSEDDIFGNVGDYVPSHEPTGDSSAVINEFSPVHD
jgi:hypothetical protein